MRIIAKNNIGKIGFSLMMFFCGFVCHVLLTDKTSSINQTDSESVEKRSDVSRSHGFLNKSDLLVNDVVNRLDLLSPSSTQELIDQSRKGLSLAMFSRLAELDPAAAAEMADSVKDDETKQLWGEILASLWSEVNPAAAMRWFSARKDQFEPSDYENFIDTVAYALILDDPAHAASVLSPEFFQKDHFLLGMAQGWASKDSEQAFRWLETLDTATVSPAMLTECYLSIMLVYAKDDPLSAASVVQEIEPGGLLEQLAGSVALSFAEAHPQEVAEWIGRLKTDKARRAALHAIVKDSNGDKMGLAVDAIIANEFGPEEIEAVFAVSTQLDPVGTADRLLKLPVAVQSTAAAAIASEWIASSPEEAENWLRSLPAGPVLDAAALNTAQWYVRDDPASAVDWGSVISHDETRMKLFKDIIRFADDVDIERVGQQLQQLKMIPSERTEIETVLNHRFSKTYVELVIPQE